jgi:hypothetical protein
LPPARYRGVHGIPQRPPIATACRTAFKAIQQCWEGDGALHWRPEVVYALATR